MDRWRDEWTDRQTNWFYSISWIDNVNIGHLKEIQKADISSISERSE